MQALVNSSMRAPWLAIAIAALALTAMLGIRPAAAADLPTFLLVIKDGRFIPETLEVPANTKFRLQIKNEGPGPEEFESAALNKEKVVAAGVTTFLIFQPLKPGSYPFIGEFHPKTAKGTVLAR